MKILIIGANGRMGKQVVQICQKQNIDFVGVDINSQNYKQQFDDDCKSCDVAIDFSCAEAVIKNIEFCIKNKMNIVVATTGHSQQNMTALQNAKKYIAVFVASNLSLGFFKVAKAIEIIDNKNMMLQLLSNTTNTKKITQVVRQRCCKNNLS